VHHAVVEQQPVVLKFPRAASAMSIQKIAQSLVGQPRIHSYERALVK